jgi:N-methylhydantoinase A
MERMATAHGIVQVASAVIVKAIRTISIERGHDPAEFALFAFGGAGPLHGHDVARDLGVRRIVVPPNPGILCAEGLLGSDMTADFVVSRLSPYDATVHDSLNGGLDELTGQAEAWFRREEVAEDDRRLAWYVDLRYTGQNFELSIPISGQPFDEAAVEALRRTFEAAHEQAYGFAQPGEPMEVVHLRLAVTGILPKPALPEWPEAAAATAVGARRVMFDDGAWHETPVYRRTDLARDQRLDGPAVIEQMDSTIPVFPGDVAQVDAWGNLVVDIGGEA